MKFSKFIITAAASLFFIVLLLLKIKVGIALSFILLFFPVYWIISKSFDEKKFIIFVLIIHPLLPFLSGISIGMGIPILRPHRIVVLLLIIFLIRKGLFLKYYSSFIKSNIFTFNLLLIISSMIVTSILSSNMRSTLFFTFSYVFELLIFTVVVFEIFQTDQEIDELIGILIIPCVILCVFGLFEKFSGYNFYSEFGVYDDAYIKSLSHQIRSGGIRVKTSFNHAIAYGTYLVMILPLFLYKFRNDFIKFNLSVLLIMSAVLASQSRAGFLGALIIFSLYFIFVERKNIFLILIISIPFILYKMDDISQFLTDVNPLTTTNQEMANSTSARAEQFIMLIEYIKQNILFGYGMVIAGLGSIDNFYLLYTYQYGIVGLFAQLSLLITVCIKPFIIIGIELFRDLRLLLILFSIFTFSIINLVVCLWSFHFIFYIYIGIIARIVYNKRIGVNAQYNYS